MNIDQIMTLLSFCSKGTSNFTAHIPFVAFKETPQSWVGMFFWHKNWWFSESLVSQKFNLIKSTFWVFKENGFEVRHIRVPNILLQMTRQWESDILFLPNIFCFVVNVSELCGSLYPPLVSSHWFHLILEVFYNSPIL